MKKKLLALLLAMSMMVFALAAYSNQDASQSQNPSQDVTPSNEPADSQEPANSDAGSATGDYGEFTTVEEGKLIMSTNAAFPPYEMTSDGEGYNGTGFEGIDVEIAGAIADKLGLELHIDDMDFTASLEAAQKGMSDMVMAGVTVDEDRLAVMDFSNSYATGVQVIIVKEGSDVTLDNLGEQLIGVQNGTTGWQYRSPGPDERPGGLRGHRPSPRPVLCRAEPRPDYPGYRIRRGGLCHRRGQGQHQPAQRHQHGFGRTAGGRHHPVHY